MPRLLIVMMVCVLLAGCRQQQADLPRLVELDSLIAVAPDSAAALLEAIPADSLPTAADRAYRALLLTQAKYKADIHAYRLDTINLAVDYFADGHDKDKRTRSLLYKGCVMEELPQLDSAMYYYKYAEDMATQSGDTYHCGYALMRQAWMYQCQYDTRCAIDLYRMAQIAFEACHDNDLTLQTLYTTASLYITINPDSALELCNRAMKLSLEMDKARFDYCNKTLADIYFVKKAYRRSIVFSQAAISSTVDRDVYFHCHQLIAQSFAHLGLPDSSQCYLYKSVPPLSRHDTLMLKNTLSIVAAANNDPQAGDLHMHVMDMADTIVNNSSAKVLEQAAFDYMHSSAAMKHHDLSRKLSMGLALLAFSLVLLAVVVMLIHRKRSCLANENLQLTSKLEQKTSEISSYQRSAASLSGQIQTLEKSNEELSQQVKEKQMLLARADSELSQLREALAISSLSARDEVRAQDRTRRLEVLSEEVRRQAIAHTQAIKTLSNSPVEIKRMMRQHFDKEYCLRLQMLADVLYPKLMSNVNNAMTPLDDDEVVVACMHFLNFPSKVIGAYLGHTSKYSISHKKTLIAEKVFGKNAKISQMAQ